MQYILNQIAIRAQLEFPRLENWHIVDGGVGNEYASFAPNHTIWDDPTGTLCCESFFEILLALEDESARQAIEQFPWDYEMAALDQAQENEDLMSQESEQSSES
jgi:hypothetical protein